MKEVFHPESNLSEEQIAAMVNDVVTLQNRFEAYKAELESLNKAIVAKTIELSKHIIEPVVVVYGNKAIPVDVEKTNRRIIVKDPVYCVNL
jgi:hypothetical protein